MQGPCPVTDINTTIAAAEGPPDDDYWNLSLAGQRAVGSRAALFCQLQRPAH